MHATDMPLPALGYSEITVFCQAWADMHAVGMPLLALGYQGLRWFAWPCMLQTCLCLLWAIQGSLCSAWLELTCMFQSHMLTTC